MANRYSQALSSQPVSTYKPLPLTQYANLAQGIKNSYDTSKLFDAKNRMFLKRFAGQFDDPVLKKGAEDVVQRFSEKLGARAEEGNYEDMLIETKLDAEEVGQIAQNFQNIQEQDQARREEFWNQEGVPDFVKEQYFKAAGAGKEYDPESMTARLTGELPQLQEHADLVEVVNDALKGTKADQFVDFVQAPNGELMVETTEGFSEAEALDLAERAIASNPQAQQTVRQLTQAYAYSAIDQEDPVGSLISGAPESRRDELAERSARLREQGLSDEEIYGTILAEDEVTNAIGFGQSKYGFNAQSLKGAPGEGGSVASNEDAYFTNETVNLRAINNPVVGEMPEDVGEASIDSVLSLEGLPTEMTKTMARHSLRGARIDDTKYIKEKEKRIQELKDGLNKSDLDEYLNKEAVKGVYGDALKTIKDQIPQKEGENVQDWLDRVSPVYHQMKEYHSSIRNQGRRIRIDKAEDYNNQMFGKDSDVRPGLAQDRGFMVTTAGGETDVISLEDLAKRNGMKIKDLTNRMTAIAKTGEDDPLGMPSTEVRIAKGDEGIFWDNQEIESVKMLESSQGRTQRLAPLLKINSLKHNIKKSSTEDMEVYLPEEGGTVRLRGKAEPVIDNGQYQGRRLAIELLDESGEVQDVLREGEDEAYHALMTKIKNR